MRNLAQVWWLLAGALLACAAPALAQSAADANGRLDRFLQGLQTLKADFAQEIAARGSEEQHYWGVLYLQRPGRFRWEYQVPDQLIVADGDTVWLVDRELEQVSRKGQAAALAGTPAQLLIGGDPPQEHFTIESLGDSGELAWLALIPKARDSEFVRILLGFAEDELRQLEMVDSFGQLTRFHFSNVARNPPLDPELFRYRAPPGMDVFAD